MESLILKIIHTMDTPLLAAIIVNWNDYSPKIVLLSYSELKKRNYSISE